MHIQKPWKNVLDLRPILPTTITLADPPLGPRPSVTCAMTVDSSNNPLSGYRFPDVRTGAQRAQITCPGLRSETVRAPSFEFGTLHSKALSFNHKSEINTSQHDLQMLLYF